MLKEHETHSYCVFQHKNRPYKLLLITAGIIAYYRFIDCRLPTDCKNSLNTPLDFTLGIPLEEFSGIPQFSSSGISVEIQLGFPPKFQWDSTGRKLWDPAEFFH